jgi:serine/threonine-protein kinase
VAGFRIEALLGQGSTGTVYSAQDVALQRRVALKVLLPELARDARFRERFLRESRLAAALEHPHIVPIHSVGETDGVLFLAMRYVGNGDLARLLERVGRIEPDRALLICSHVAGALDAAHAHDLIHRDVKPGNVLLGRDADHDYAYLCDFGLAKLGTSVTSLSGTRDIIGTVGYLSPEQIDGLPVDGRTDVYALGCVLFECLAGEPPFVRENELATILAHRSEPPPAISDRRPELPEALDAVIARALAKDREARYATCGELVRDARRALEGQPVAAPPAPAKTGPALLTFVFADIRGYTAYMREHGDEVGARMAEQFAAIVEPLARAHGGTAPRLHGDEALVIFDSTRAALRYAVDLQQQVERDRLPCGVGIGIDAGEAVVSEQDLHGGGLNRAARLCARAKAGEILATDSVVHLAGRFDEVGYGFRRLERVKGFEEPIGATEVHPAGTPPRHAHRRRVAGALRGRRPRLRLAIAAAVVAAGAALIALTAGGGGENAPPFEPNSIAVLDAASGAPVGTVAPGLRICMFAAAGSDLWACDADQSILLRVDARRRRVVDQVPLPTYHGSFAVGFGSIWVGDVASPTVRKVSVRFRTSSPPIRLPGIPAASSGGEPQNVGSMVVTRDAVWAAYGFPKRIAKIDPASGKVRFSVPMRQDCPCNVWLASGDGKLWAVGGDGAHIYRIDPRTGRTSATGRLHHGSVTGAAVAGGYLWVAMREDGGVWKIGDSGESIDKVPTGRGPASLQAAGGRVWVANADDGTVTAIDPGSDATRQYRVGHRPLAVAELGGKVFVGLGQSTTEAAAGLSGTKVVRGVGPGFAFASDPVAFGSADLVEGRASGAGLMAAITDAHGTTTIEPELAREPPAVSDDGRTYRFRLRPGLRFSSGEPVTAEAVKYSIERAVAPKLVNHYCRDLVLNDVAGEDAYEAGRADRIAGIRAEGDGVSITLARPSPTLPARLTNPCLSVVPPGTPALPVGLQRPIPSAGPYYIASFIPGQQTVLRRNPEYEGPRPPHLDAIVLRSGTRAEEAGTLVERGLADYAADPEPNLAPAFARGGRYEQRFGRPGAKLRYVRPPSPVTAFVLFNTRRGLFRDAQLRRAVNLALDRTALGDGDGGDARTLLIPPGVPGHRDAQAYPLQGDLRRARALAAGRGGTAVLAVMPEPPQARQVAEQVARQLARIGITLSVRVLADPAAAAADPRHPVDAVFDGWAPDYPDPFDAVNVILDPSARVPTVPDFFGDRRWVRRMRQAAAAPLGRRDAVYAKLDADLARGPAPLAVLGGPPGLPHLLSARLGCERYFFGVLDVSALCINGE